MSGASEYRGTVVVTGASSGFGKGTAPELARHGACVVLAARSTQIFEALARECETAGGQALAVMTNVSERAAVGVAQGGRVQLALGIEAARSRRYRSANPSA